MRDGELLVPTDHTRGPWDPGAQHGGPPSALLARTLEAAPSPVPMRLARLGVRLLRPVPLRPLRATATVVRDGRRVQLVEAALHCDGAQVCRATGLRIRVTEPAHAARRRRHRSATARTRPGPGARPRPRRVPAFLETGGRDALRPRLDAPGRAGDGLGAAAPAPVVEGEEPSPLVRVAALADFGNGVSSLLSWEDWLFINPELTVYCHRPPRGEWICLDARTELSPAGVGVAHSVLSDEHGSIGHALQALLVDERRRDGR